MVNGEWRAVNGERWMVMTMSHCRERFSRLPFINLVGRRIIASMDTWARFNIQRGEGYTGYADYAYATWNPRIPLVLLPVGSRSCSTTHILYFELNFAHK